MNFEPSPSDPRISETLPIVYGKAGLTQDGMKCTHGHLAVFRHNGGPYAHDIGLGELDVASLLPRFVKAGREKPSPNFTIKERLKRHGGPRLCSALRAGSWRLAA